MDVQTIQKDFPVLKRQINGKPIVYLDSTATSLKPYAVIDAINGYYHTYTANVFRGIYVLSEEATTAYEEARATIASFIHALPTEIIFTKNASESLNLLAYTVLPMVIKQNDTVVTTIMEHHSNFVPWQQLVPKYGGKMKIWDITKDFVLDEEHIETLIDSTTKIVTLTAVSNVLGTIVPIKKLAARIKKISPHCLVFVDAAQAVPHMPVDVVDLGVDAIAFSGHKMLGPTGIGVVWVKNSLLATMPPFLYGGDMISEVHRDETKFNALPHKFEAGTPYIEGAIGLGAAVKYLHHIGMENVRNHEKELVMYAMSELKKMSGVTIYGPTDPEIHGGVIAFRLDGIHPHDVAQVLDEENVCIRVGYHCAMPLHETLGVGATCRASFYIYNTKSDIDALVLGIQKVKKLFG